MLTKLCPARKIRGFTLTEAAIVLGIVGMILGAIWVAAAAVYNNLRVNKTSTQLLQIAQSVRSIHSTQNAVDANITAVIVAQAGGIPKDMLDSPTAPTSVTDIWGGAVAIGPASSSATTPNDSFYIDFPNVPSQACADLSVQTTGSGRDSGLIGVSYTAATPATATTFPINISTATTSCGNGLSKDIVFTFKLKG
jgi:Tfp pilus assembly protein FimT